MITMTGTETERCVLLADYLITHNATVRATAHYYGISKSTVHKDITEKLAKCNPFLFDEVREVLEKNKAERHLRGGEATKRKYEEMKEGGISPPDIT